MNRKAIAQKALISAAMLTFMLGTPAFAEMTMQKTVVIETAPSVAASTTTTTTVTQAPPTAPITTYWQTEPNGIRTISFIDFDLNKDGILTRDDIGQILFKLYDTDGNSMIDGNEYDHRIAAAIKPIETSSVITYDFDGDGIADKTQYTYETAMQETMLSRLDQNKNGLSAREFTGLGFNAADVNNDRQVDSKEWQGTYIASIDAANKAKAHINK